jgi:cytidine deaminase
MNTEQTFQFTYASLAHWNQLPSKDHALVAEAFLAMGRAYAPYSQFKVGAAASLATGEIICGNNQENIAFPSGLCAERVALNYIGANYPGIEIQTLCIVARGALMPEKQLLSPCGGCRQVMLESENRQGKPIRVILVNQDNRTIIVSAVKDLLPFGFGKEGL